MTSGFGINNGNYMFLAANDNDKKNVRELISLAPNNQGFLFITQAGEDAQANSGLLAGTIDLLAQKGSISKTTSNTTTLDNIDTMDHYHHDTMSHYGVVLPSGKNTTSANKTGTFKDIPGLAEQLVKESNRKPFLFLTAAQKETPKFGNIKDLALADPDAAIKMLTQTGTSIGEARFYVESINNQKNGVSFAA